MNTDPDLHFSLRRALEGDVPANLYAVTAGLKEKHITIEAFFYEIPSVDDIEFISIAGTETIADFPEDYTIEEHCFPVTEEEPEMLDFWAFKRTE